MQPYLKKIIIPPRTSVVFKEDHLENIRDWHFHPEIEIQLNLCGHGTKFIGDCVEPFGGNELLLLGENLPHFWRKTTDQLREIEIEDKAHMIVVQFRKDFLGEDFYLAPEFEAIQQLLERSRRGLLFYGQTRQDIQSMLLEFHRWSPLERLLSLIRVLDRMAETQEFRYLCHSGYLERFHENHDDRIDRIYEYTLTHFRRNIRIVQIAVLVNMSETAFCRYFKSRTQKQYSQFLIELRIGYACEQLIYSDKDIKCIGPESGFNSHTNFHRQFKKIMRLTPVEYRALHRKL